MKNEAYIQDSWSAAHGTLRSTRRGGTRKPKNPPVFVDEMPEHAVISHRGIMLYNIATDKFAHLNGRKQLKWVDQSIYCVLNNDEDIPDDAKTELRVFVSTELRSCILVPAVVWQSVLSGNKRIYYVECDFTKSYMFGKI